MEKLQAALATARQNRTGKAPERRLTEDLARRKQQRSAGSVVWSQLEEFHPPADKLREHRVVTQTASSAATPFDILRTKILLQMQQNGWTRLAITSPMPDSGKTTTACNLALGLARQKELRSMLFDMDLRDPSVNQFFEKNPRNSIGSLLEGDVSFEEQALRIGDNLAISMASSPESDPSRILLSEQATTVLDEVQQRFQPDVMIFDLPSVLVNDDTRAFLKNVDCALIISRANTTKYSQFDICEREIAEHTNVLGVVLNACRHGRGSTDFA